MQESLRLMHYNALDRGHRKHGDGPPRTGGSALLRKEHERKIVSASIALRVFVAVAFTALVALRAPDVRADVLPTYAVDFHAIGAGGATLRNSCFHLAGTLAQPAPGYSAASSGTPIYSLYAGFWSANAATGADEVFFAGFEVC